METTKVLTKEEKQAKALGIWRKVLKSQRQSQIDTLEEMKDPNSSLRKAVDELRKENAIKGHPYAI